MGKKENKTVVMKANGNQTSVAYDGENYNVDSRGLIEVPAEAAPELEAHGFKIYIEPKKTK